MLPLILSLRPRSSDGILSKKQITIKFGLGAKQGTQYMPKYRNKKFVS